MFFDFEVMMEKPAEVGWLLLAFIGGKRFWPPFGFVHAISTEAAWLAGVGLAQFGEFGFVLLQLAARKEWSQTPKSPLTECGILSMFLTPLLVYKAPHFTAGERALDPLAKLLRARSAEGWKIQRPGTLIM